MFGSTMIEVAIGLAFLLLLLSLILSAAREIVADGLRSHAGADARGAVPVRRARHVHGHPPDGEAARVEPGSAGAAAGQVASRQAGRRVRR